VYYADGNTNAIRSNVGALARGSSDDTVIVSGGSANVSVEVIPILKVFGSSKPVFCYNVLILIIYF
jgi:hypothetical protein